MCARALARPCARARAPQPTPGRAERRVRSAAKVPCRAHTDGHERLQPVTACMRVATRAAFFGAAFACRTHFAPSVLTDAISGEVRSRDLDIRHCRAALLGGPFHIARRVSEHGRERAARAVERQREIAPLRAVVFQGHRGVVNTVFPGSGLPVVFSTGDIIGWNRRPPA